MGCCFSSGSDSNVNDGTPHKGPEGSRHAASGSGGGGRHYRASPSTPGHTSLVASTNHPAARWTPSPAPSHSRGYVPPTPTPPRAATTHTPTPATPSPVVPTPAPSTSHQPSTSRRTSRLNLNTASRARLEALPGLGPALVTRIIDARPFTPQGTPVADALHSLPGFGAKRVKQLQHLVFVGPTHQLQHHTTVKPRKTPHPSPAPPSPSHPPSPTKLDINTATYAQLVALPGVGKRTANSIIAHRPYAVLRELELLSGFGARTVAALSHHLCIGAPRATPQPPLPPLPSPVSGAVITPPTAEQPSTAARTPSQRPPQVLPASSPLTSRPAPLPEPAPLPPGAPVDLRRHGPCGVPSGALVVDKGKPPAPPLLGALSWDTRGGSTLLVGSWNVRNLSKKRSPQDFATIASIIAQFDVIAIQEVRDVQCLKELQSRLNAAAASTRSKSRPMWQYVVSPPIGRGLRNQDAAHVHEERYAYFWQDHRVELVGHPAVVQDPEDVFVREPYVACFRARATVKRRKSKQQHNMTAASAPDDGDSSAMDTDELPRKATSFNPARIFRPHTPRAGGAGGGAGAGAAASGDHAIPPAARLPHKPLSATAATALTDRFSFVLVSVHVVFGSGADKSARRAEVGHLQRLMRYIRTRCAERGVPHSVLVGDFNTPPSDVAWSDDTMLPLLVEPMSSTVFNNLYDNMWITPATTLSQWTGYSGVLPIDYILYPHIGRFAYKQQQAKAARKQCNKHVSDHRPAWALFHATTTTTTTTHAAGFKTAKHTPSGMLHATSWSPALSPAVHPTPQQHGGGGGGGITTRRQLFRDDGVDTLAAKAKGMTVVTAGSSRALHGILPRTASLRLTELVTPSTPQ